MRKRKLLLAPLVVLAVAAASVVPAAAASRPGDRSTERKLKDDAEGAFEALESAEQYAEARTAPADTVDAARSAARTRRRERCRPSAGRGAR